MTANKTARSTIAYLIVRDQAHENAYAKALETLGVDWNKLLPIPKTNAEKFPEVKKLVDLGPAEQAVHLRPRPPPSEAGRIFQGMSPSKDGTELDATEQAPEGVPSTIADGALRGVLPRARPGAARAHPGHGRPRDGRGPAAVRPDPRDRHEGDRIVTDTDLTGRKVLVARHHVRGGAGRARRARRPAARRRRHRRGRGGLRPSRSRRWSRTRTRGRRHPGHHVRPTSPPPSSTCSCSPAAPSTPTRCGCRPRPSTSSARSPPRGSPIAAICHGPWALVEADVVRGRSMTSYPSLQTDLRNAGASWVDEPVVARRRRAASRWSPRGTRATWTSSSRPWRLPPLRGSPRARERHAGTRRHA